MAAFSTRLRYAGKVYTFFGAFPSRAHAVGEGEQLEQGVGAKVVILPRGGQFGVYAFIPRRAKKNPRWPKGLTQAKARQILHEGVARGRKLTEAQRRMFGARASGYPKKNFFPPLSHTKRKKLVLYVPEIGEFVHDHKRAMKESKKNPALQVFGLANPPKRKTYHSRKEILHDLATRKMSRKEFLRLAYLLQTPIYALGAKEGFPELIFRQKRQYVFFDVFSHETDAIQTAVALALTPGVKYEIMELAGQYGLYIHTPLNENPLTTKKIRNNPHSAGDLMSDSVLEVRYLHRKDGEPYKHAFKPGVRMRANEDGTITLYHPTKRIWNEFPE